MNRRFKCGKALLQLSHLQQLDGGHRQVRQCAGTGDAVLKPQGVQYPDFEDAPYVGYGLKSSEFVSARYGHLSSPSQSSQAPRLGHLLGVLW